MINALGFQFMCKEFDMDLETVSEIAATPVPEKAYDDLFHPSAESIGKTVGSVRPRLT